MCREERRCVILIIVWGRQKLVILQNEQVSYQIVLSLFNPISKALQLIFEETNKKKMGLIDVFALFFQNDPRYFLFLCFFFRKLLIKN